MTDSELVRLALEARRAAYAPYSGFLVGAALLCRDGSVYTGCNIESASYTPTCCAERVAFFKAVSEGKRAFEAIAVMGAHRNAAEPGYAYPCGVCRQVMMEFCDPGSFRILTARTEKEYTVFTLRELLPMAFGPAELCGSPVD